MAFPCQPYDPIRGLLTKAEMICRSMSLGYAEDGPTYAALQQAALEIAALPVPAASSERADNPQAVNEAMTEILGSFRVIDEADQAASRIILRGILERCFAYRHSGADK